MGLPRRELINHTPGRPQQWVDVDEDVRDWVGAIVDVVVQVDAVLGAYLHGSLAMGGFYRPKSDVDLLVVTEASLDDRQRRSLATQMLALFDQRPIVGGIELSVIRRGYVESSHHPAPYEFHFSEIWADDVRRGGRGPNGTDRDLAAHCAVTRARGVALTGPDPSIVFGAVPRWAYLDAILDDLRWILDGGIIESPFYGVLNICRCAHVLLGNPEVPPSKDESGQWALDHLPAEHRAVVVAAVECYRSDALVPVNERSHHGHSWDEQPLLDIASWARTSILTESRATSQRDS